jgi:P-type conjugative transfer protein TrbL
MAISTSAAMGMGALSYVTQTYIHVFTSYTHQFIQWGAGLFISLLSISLAWLGLHYAFNKDSFTDAMSDFLKRFWKVSLFYFLLIQANWLLDLLHSIQWMGQSLLHAPVDPSSIIADGIGLGNKIIIPISKSSLLTMGFSMIVIGAVYLGILFVFISIAIDLAATLISTLALISMSSLFLAFGALETTQNIARQCLDTILGNCVKLLGIYLTVGTGMQTVNAIVNSIPIKVIQLDPYAWVVASVWLLWVLSKNLPNQLGRMVSGTLHEHQGTSAAALAMAAVQIAKTATPPAKMAVDGAMGIAKIAGGALANAKAHFNDIPSSGGLGSRATLAASRAAVEVTKAGLGAVSDHFKHLSNKLSGGPGLANRRSDIPGVAERLYSQTQDLKERQDNQGGYHPPNDKKGAASDDSANNPTATQTVSKPIPPVAKEEVSGSSQEKHNVSKPSSTLGTKK